MRRTIALAAVLLLVVVWAVVPRAQFGFGRRERLSPHESTAATIDGAKLSIVYGRPSMRGRQIFGHLVRFDEVWCPGADEATMLTTDHGLRFSNFQLPSGEYSLWMLPTRTDWTLIVNSVAHTFHLDHEPDADLARIPLRKQVLTAPVEQLTFSLENNPSEPGGSIVMQWETTKVSAPFTVMR
jgi:hypothetical protein